MIAAAVLQRPAAARALDWEDLDVLRIAGRQAASYLAESQSQAALSEAQRFDEFNRRFAFIMHDIKNLASQLSLLARNARSEEHTSELQSLMRISYAVFCLKKKKPKSTEKTKYPAYRPQRNM